MQVKNINSESNKNTVLNDIKTNTKLKHKVRVLKVLLILFITCGLIGGAYAADWPQFHYDAAHTGITNALAPHTNDTFDIANQYSPTSSPVISNNKIFISRSDWKVNKLTLLNGELELDSEYPVGRGVQSTPAISNGKVFVGARQYIRALNEDELDLIGLTIQLQISG